MRKKSQIGKQVYGLLIYGLFWDPSFLYLDLAYWTTINVRVQLFFRVLYDHHRSLNYLSCICNALSVSLSSLGMGGYMVEGILIFS